MKIYVLNVFTKISFLIEVVETSRNISFISILLTDSEKNFENRLQKNLLKPGIVLLQEHDLRTKMNKKAMKYLKEKVDELAGPKIVA